MTPEIVPPEDGWDTLPVDREAWGIETVPSERPILPITTTQEATMLVADFVRGHPEIFQ